MKCVISNRIWLPVQLETREMLEECTHKVPLNDFARVLSTSRGGLPYRIIKTYTRPTKTIVSFPVGRMDLVEHLKEVEFVDKRADIPLPHFPEFTGKLRESQQDAVNYAARFGNIIIKAKPGWGKTFTALAIAAMLKQKTLVLMHTKALMEQWVVEIEKVLGIKAGIIGDQQYIIGDCITVGLIKSCHKNRMALSKEFGLVIVDEVHHLPAEQFSEFINVSYAKYKIGMSGTLERVDKTHVVIEDYISTYIFSAPEENTMEPVVHVINLPIHFDNYLAGSYAAKITELNQDPVFIKTLASICKTYETKGHKVLCVMERVTAIEHLARVADGIPYHYETPVEIKETAFAKIESGVKNILVGSMRIFYEGISENYLSALVLGVSTSGPPFEQVIGRILRNYPNKLTPIIVDVRIKGKSHAKQAGLREDFYEQKGWQVLRFEL